MATNKSQLIVSLENTFKMNFGDEIDEFVLRGIWRRNSYESLYLCNIFNNFSSVDKARFEGIVDAYFNKNNIKQSKQESSPLLSPYNTEQIAEPDPSSLNDIELQVASQPTNSNKKTIPTPSDNYPICGNACMDCCEDVCEHAICCNCASVIYDVWDESIQADNNNVVNPVNNNDELKNDDVVQGIFHNACEDCCEDICEHAICCNCTASIVSHWFEAADIDNGNELEPVLNGDDNDIENNNMFKLQEKAFKHIQKARKICCAFACLFLFILIAIATTLFYFLYYKPKYE